MLGLLVGEGVRKGVVRGGKQNLSQDGRASEATDGSGVGILLN